MDPLIISELESSIGDSHACLPEDVFLFVSRITPLINVDLLIQDDAGRTLLTWRDDEFFGAGWHVPGGIIRYKELAVDRIRACAKAELGAEVAFDSSALLVFENIRPHRSRGHFISLLYRCRLLTQLDQARCAVSGAPLAGMWSWHQACPPDLIDAQACYKPFFQC